MEYAEIHEDLKYEHLGLDGDEKIKFSGSQPFGQDWHPDNAGSATNYKAFYDNNEFCRITGNINLPKVAGDLIFHIERGQGVVKFLRDNPTYQDRVQINHRINKMTFGSETNHEEILKVFGEVDNGQHTMFNMFHPDSKVKWTHKMVPDETN